MDRTLSLSIDPALLTRFPSLRVGSFVALRLDRASSSVVDGEFGALTRHAAVPLATLNMAIGMRYQVRVRGYDLDALPVAAIVVRAVNPRSDWFLPMGARPTDVPLDEVGLVHASSNAVLSWVSTARESRQTCLCATTTRAAFVADALTAAQARGTAAALNELRQLLTTNGAVVSDVSFVDATVPRAEISCADAAVSW